MACEGDPAFGAMLGRKPLRELGRFRGFVAGRGGPEALEREALTEGTGTYDVAPVCQARYKP
jgi:hypothetical protein